MPFDRGYKVFEKRSVAVMFKKYNQMEDMEMLSVVHTDLLTEGKK